MNDASRERRGIRDVRCRNPGSREATKTVASAKTPQGEKMAELGSQMSAELYHELFSSVLKEDIDFHELSGPRQR